MDYSPQPVNLNTSGYDVPLSKATTFLVSMKQVFDFTAIFKGLNMNVLYQKKRTKLYMCLPYFSTINTIIWYYQGIRRTLEGMNK